MRGAATIAPKRRFTEHGPLGKPLTLAADHPAARDGHTMFPTRRIAALDAVRLLKRGEHSRKIGSHVVKGAWSGMPIYTLTLEERATCPRSCLHWLDCYGNHMHFNERIQVDAGFAAKLAAELDCLAAYHPDGFVVRLHVLGDFASLAYVWLWRDLLARQPGLRIFGYTAHQHDDLIGAALAEMNGDWPSRCAIRFSNGAPSQPRTVTVDHASEAGDAIICPAQTGKSDCCGTCALCWSSPKPIAFLRH